MKARPIFVQQGNVTVVYGKVPVLYKFDERMDDLLAAAVNFLRSGCPAVQVLVQEVDDRDRLVSLAETRLADLQIGDESFLVLTGDEFSRVLTIRISQAPKRS